MQLSSSEPCVVILTEKEVEVSVNNHATFTLPKNYLAAFACNNNVIELSTLNHVLITHINRNIINDYLLFLNKNLTCVKPWSRLATPVIACHSRTPEVFRLAANHSKQQPSKPCEAELTRALLFTVLSNGHCGGTGHRRSADTAEVFNGLLKTFYGHTSPFQRRRLTAGGTPRPSQR